MEDNEDESDDVRQAAPVNEELGGAEIAEESSSPVEEYHLQRNKTQQIAKEVPKKFQKPVKTKEDCCEKKLKKLSKNSRDRKTVTVLINEKECTIQRPEIIPRHCLSKKEWLNLLATPQRKCPSPCSKKKVERKLRPMSQRINELAQPTRQRMLSTLEDRAEILPTELVDKLVNVLEGETCLTPEQAEKLFHDEQLKKQSKIMHKEKRSKCQSDIKIRKSSGHVVSVNLDKEAVTCQYLMAEAFVKSILCWRSQIPKEEFTDIADIVVKRLANTLEYNLVDSADRTTQQMRFLADIIAAWIAGILFEVAENQRDNLERECEEKQRMKDEEELSDETTESEDDGFIPPKMEQLAMAKPEKKEEEDEEDGKPRDKDKGEKRDDDRRDDDDDTGAGGAVKQEPMDEDDSPDAPEEPGEDEKYYTAVNSPEADDEQTDETREEIEAITDEAAPNVAEDEDARKAPSTELPSAVPSIAPEAEAIGGEVPDEDATILAKESEIRAISMEEVQEAVEASSDSAEAKSEVNADSPDGASVPPKLLQIDEEQASIAEALPTDSSLPRTPKDSETASKISEEISREAEDPRGSNEELGGLLEDESGEKLGTDEVEVSAIAHDLEADESIKLSTELETEALIESIGAKNLKESRPVSGKGQDTKPRIPQKDSEFIEGNLKKMLQTDVPFLDLLKILDRIENAVATEKENIGDDLMTDRIHRAIYEKFERLGKAESPERLTNHLKDVLDVLSGKIAKWVRNIMTESEILYLNDNPPLIESGELRSFGEWLGDMSDRANNWTMWMQRMISQLVDMQGTQVTRGDWQNWTRNFAMDALKWRHYYLESIHHAHHNRTMLAGREVVKTGEVRYPEWSIQEKEINTTNFLQE